MVSMESVEPTPRSRCMCEGGLLAEGIRVDKTVD